MRFLCPKKVRRSGLMVAGVTKSPSGISRECEGRQPISRCKRFSVGPVRLQEVAPAQEKQALLACWRVKTDDEIANVERRAQSQRATQRMSQRKRRKAPEEAVKSALRLSREDDLEGAVRALSSLADEYPEDLEVRFAAASVLFRLDRYAEAVPHFERVLADDPTHEWASLGLFHSFWKTDRPKEALRELRRFADAGGESMEYRRLQRDVVQAIENPED